MYGLAVSGGECPESRMFVGLRLYAVLRGSEVSTELLWSPDEL